MTEPALTARDLIAWLEKTSTGWRDLLTHNPELFTLPCDITGVQTVAQLLQHIVAVELRYAERLADQPVTDYANIPYDSVEAIYATHDRAIALLQKLLDSEVDWNETIEFTTRTRGSARSARKTILFHLLLHGIRHYAQLSTLVRQHGVQPGWLMDYLFMDMEHI
ncbi:DinB family protein [Tunturiibacter gelidiferens]|uniref:DinB family protein n=1 Tax=Tunturiibacter gelidiferens TaxID=3069689 RepID=UPI003D9B2693